MILEILHPEQARQYPFFFFFFYKIEDKFLVFDQIGTEIKA